MIKNKKELKFYIKADFIMNRGDYSFKNRFVCLLNNDLVIKYLRTLRKYEYYSNKHSLIEKLFKYKLKRISYKTGITLAPNVFSYGLVIPHHGTIVVGGGNQIGKYCVLHTSTCITEGKKIIGDGFYLSAGAKVYKDIQVNNFVTLTMNSVLNSNVDIAGSVCAGSPAKIVKNSEPWYIRDGEKFNTRVEKCETIKNKTFK